TRLQLVAACYLSFPHNGWHRFGFALSFHPLLTSPNQTRTDVSLFCQVERYGAVYLFERKELEILANRIRRLAAPERMDDRVEGDSCARNVVVAVPLLDVLRCHVSFDCTASWNGGARSSKNARFLGR